MTTLTKRRPRRQPTEGQRAQATERRTQMRRLARSVSAMSKDERAQIAARFGVVTIEGRALSPFNACMIWAQNDGATVVDGFRQWLRAGRCVCKGQHGLAIWVPTGRRDKPEDGDGKEPGEDSEQRPTFILGTVFDISQTSETETGKAVA